MRRFSKVHLIGARRILLSVPVFLTLLVSSFYLQHTIKAPWLSDVVLNVAFLFLTVALVDWLVTRSQERAEKARWSRVEEAIGQRATRAAALAVNSFLSEPSIRQELERTAEAEEPIPDFADLFAAPPRGLAFTERRLLPLLRDWYERSPVEAADMTAEGAPGISAEGWGRITGGIQWSLHVLGQMGPLFGGQHAPPLQRAIMDLETAATNFVGYQSTWGPGLNTGARGAYLGSGAGVRHHQKGSLQRATRVVAEAIAVLRAVIARDE